MRCSVRAAVIAVSSVSSILLCVSAGFAQASPDALRALGEVRALSDKVESFRANLEVRDKQPAGEQVTTSNLTVAKDKGWHIRSNSDTDVYEFVCDFTTLYQYYPAEKRAFKHTPGAEMQPMLRKPVTDLNPLNLLDPASVKYKGKAEIMGEPVHHFEGTTSTQFIPEGKPVLRKMEAWISVKDGLPRKTIETVGPAVGTTIYTNVELNPALAPDEFTFTPPAGVQVIDATAQMQAMEEQQRKAAQQTPAATPDDNTTAGPRPADAMTAPSEKPRD